MGQQWPATTAGALGATDLGMEQVLLEDVTVNSTIDLIERMQGWRNRLLEGHKQNLVHTMTQKKGTVTPQESDPHLSMRVQESPAEVWVSGGLLQGWGQ